MHSCIIALECNWALLEVDALSYHQVSQSCVDYSNATSESHLQLTHLEYRTVTVFQDGEISIGDVADSDRPVIACWSTGFPHLCPGTHITLPSATSANWEGDQSLHHGSWMTIWNSESYAVRQTSS
ncbi:uncharacterized protein LOC118504161 [Anopheles stephensi]|uniref:uncharacterized protein LOC118504161 n=1 Tax=Anopheles stephensi TaxID=30069 RepID=UPI001658964E|nr:uncharacterized protein LOC118504161 [Anopheles stephensi]